MNSQQIMEELTSKLDIKFDMLDLMKLRFAKLAPKKSLMVYGVPQSSLKNFKASKNKGDKGYAFDVRPQQEFRLHEEEILTQAEHDARQTEMSTMEFTEQNPDDFEFDNRSSIVVTASN